MKRQGISIRLKYFVSKCIRTCGLSSVFNIPIKILDTHKYFLNYFSTYSPQKITLYPSSFHIEPPPLTIHDRVSWKFLSFEKRIIPEAFVLRLEEGKVFGKNGAVVTKEGVLLSDVSREFGNRASHSIYTQLYLPKPVKLDKNVALLLTAGGETYYHWMFDILPRFYLIQKAGLIKSIDYFIVPEVLQRFQKESLELLNIRADQIIEVKSEDFFVQAKNLFVPSLPSLLGTVNKWATDFLKENFLSLSLPKISASDHIYISRKNANARVLLNEDSLINMLCSYGFDIIHAENYSFLEQVAIFANAKIIVSPHGSGLSNIVFSKPGTSVIELFSDDFVVPCFWIIANNSLMKYFYGHDGETDKNEFHSYWEGKATDFIFPEKKLEQLLSLAGVSG